MNDCGGISPIAHLARHGVLSDHFLAVHANYLAPGDAALLANHHASVVHCPRSHAFFGHRAFPFNELQRAGVNICLGTDSLATMAKSRVEPLALNLFSEMRTMARSFPGLSPKRILQMATVRAAEALGCGHALGCLVPGSFADLIAVPTEGGRHVYDAILDHRGDVAASMIRGVWALPPAL